MHLDLGTIVVGGFIGLIGLALLSYGRRQVRIPHIVVGLILLVYPYFVGNLIVTAVIAAALLGGLSFAARQGY